MAVDNQLLAARAVSLVLVVLQQVHNSLKYRTTINQLATASNTAGGNNALSGDSNWSSDFTNYS